MKPIIKITGYGELGNFSLEINGSVDGCSDEEMYRIASDHLDAMLEEMRCSSVKSRPDLQLKVDSQLKEFESYFREAGYKDVVVKQVPNEYWKNYYGLDKPWAKVFTESCDFLIGWRKRVIHLAWSIPGSTAVFSGAMALFPDEDVTKYDCTIHCWSPEKCKEYLRVIRNFKKS